MTDAQQESDKLRKEAKRILNGLIVGSDMDIDRLVDCLIGAAVLQIAAIQKEAKA